MAEKISGIPVKRRTDSCGSNRSPNSSHKPSCSPTQPSGNEPKLQPKSLQNESKESEKSQNSDMSQRVDSGDNITETPGAKRLLQNYEEHLNTSQLYILDSKQNMLYYILLLFMTLLGLSTRLYRIEVPSWIW